MTTHRVIVATLAAVAALLAAGCTSHRCVVEGTLVRTADGDVPIEDLAAGALVRSLGGEEQHVLRSESHWVGRVRVLHIGGGIELCVTDEHPIATSEGWVRGSVRG